ncbi:hypothetical protein [Emticicia soli]|uniref:Copper chaperone n=1 Tax=Emticicia soli TaxID=2027878 RepID=A0ABW5J4Z5_9BACT
MELFILKTNVRSSVMRDVLALQINQIPQIKKWSVDYQDCDGVLRASAEGLSINSLMALIVQWGFECEELND